MSLRPKWVGGIEVAVTRSVFHKHGGLYLDFFLKGKAARKRSAAFTFYDVTGEFGEEKTLTFERIYKIRKDQIAFLKRLYGAPEKGVVSAEGKANLALMSKMKGQKFHLHSNDDWREFLLLKYKDL